MSGSEWRGRQSVSTVRQREGEAEREYSKGEGGGVEGETVRKYSK